MTYNIISVNQQNIFVKLNIYIYIYIYIYMKIKRQISNIKYQNIKDQIWRLLYTHIYINICHSKLKMSMKYLLYNKNVL